MSDLISRQAAIDALDKTCNAVCPYSKKQRYVMCGACPLGSAFDMLCEVPSAEPEPLTDEEQRIFLSAMWREEKVCEEVDRNYMREPYKVSLMRVCKEIRRKVKGALWT